MNNMTTNLLLLMLLFSGNTYANSLGWEHEGFVSFRDGCIQGVLDGVKNNFLAMAKEKGRANIIFPEERFKPSVTELCSCITLRASQTVEYKKFIQDKNTMRTLMNEAIADGTCKSVTATGR